MMRGCAEDFLRKIRHTLSGRERKTIDHLALSRAAVLVPLFEKKEECHLLFTKRTERVKYHKGQISFPGGMVDKEDRDLEMTARRESYEEIGLKEDDLEILGALDDIVTVTQFIVTPFVGYFPYPYSYQVSDIEIAELIEVPLSHLLAPGCFAEREISQGDHQDVVSCYQYGEHIIWGATARILKQFLDLLS